MSIKHANSVMFGDNLELLKQFPDNTFSSVVTDPPGSDTTVIKV